jgi:hypothetical protein
MQKRLLDLIDHPSAELVDDLTGKRANDAEAELAAVEDEVPAKRPARSRT